MSISESDIRTLESNINDKLAVYNAQFIMTVHFTLDRLNDPRNIPPITIGELEGIFDKLIENHIIAIVALEDKDTFNIKCSSSHINMPCGVRKVTDRNGTITHKNIVITIMRKQYFHSKDPIEFVV